MNTIREKLIRWLFKGMPSSELNILAKMGYLRGENGLSDIKMFIRNLKTVHDLRYLGFELYKLKERPCGEIPSLDKETLDRFDPIKDNYQLEEIFAMWDEMRNEKL